MYSRNILPLILFFLCPVHAFAVLPPDIIFSIGTQLWQIAVGVGALVVGSITALFPFFKSASQSLPRMRVTILSVGLSLVFCGLGYLIFIAATSRDTPRVVTVQTATSTGYEYHGNRFVFLGKKANGENILINIDMNRKELSGGLFAHYYIGDVQNGAESLEISVMRDATTREVLPDLFFSQFVRILPNDHSAREAYTLSFAMGGHAYTIETDMITGDYLIKNEPEYTKYIGVGTARGVVDGESVVFHAMMERIYSTDYRPTIFFDPEGKIQSETVQLVLWDVGGNFYLVDKSDVPGGVTGYATHFWGLQKDVDGSTRRMFTGSAERTTSQNGPVEFSARFELIGRENSILLRLTQPFADEDDEGYVEGAITTNGLKTPVRGFGYHHKYGR